MKLVSLVFIGVVAWAAYRFLSRQQVKVQEDLRNAEARMDEKVSKGTSNLEQDPETGVYRPKKDKSS